MLNANIQRASARDHIAGVNRSGRVNARAAALLRTGNSVSPAKSWNTDDLNESIFQH
jgi:hypothetical protein